MNIRQAVGMTVVVGSVLWGCSQASINGSSRNTVEGVCIGGQRLELAIPSTGTVPANCVRTEGGELGSAATLKAGSTTVTFEAWRKKDGEGQYIGFTVGTPGNVAYAVKAGGETYYGTDATWVHPKGTGGPQASAISNITFCDLGGSATDAGVAPPTPTPIEPCDGRAPGGAACTNNAQCASSTCQEGKCFPEGGPGTNRPAGSACANNANCASLTCTNGTCFEEASPRPGKAPGSACTNNSGCASETCVDGTCVSNFPESNPVGQGPDAGLSPQRKPDGSACAAPSECASGVCTEGKCFAETGQLPTGAPCTNNSQCKSNLCDGTCSPSMN